MLKTFVGPPQEVMTNENLLNEGIWECFKDLRLKCDPSYDSGNNLTGYKVQKKILVAGLEAKNNELANGVAVLLSQAKEEIFNFFPRAVA